MKPPSDYFSVQLGAPDTRFVAGGAFILTGCILSWQTAATFGLFRIFDGSNTSQQIAVEASRNGQGTDPLVFPEAGILLQSGIELATTTNAVNVSLFFIPITRHADGWVDRYNNRYDFLFSP